jgi:hypothetical protein
MINIKLVHFWEKSQITNFRNEFELMLTNKPTGHSPRENADMLLKQNIDELLLAYSGTYSPDEYRKVLNRLVHIYVVSDAIEGDDKKERDRVIDMINNIDHFITRLDGIDKLDRQKKGA